MHSFCVLGEKARKRESEKIAAGWMYFSIASIGHRRFCLRLLFFPFFFLVIFMTCLLNE